MELSVVVPVYNEEESLEPFVKEVLGVVSAIGKECEVIIVDDGSTDRTYPILSDLHERDPRIKILRLKRNFGQTAALAAGIDYSKGDVIVLMDGDGQNDPKDIPALLDKIEDGFDLVCGWRHPRQDPFWSRRLASQMANTLISWMTRVNLHDSGCTLKAIRQELARNVKLYGEMHRFIPAIAHERGARIAEIKVHHRPRRWGTSKYGLSRTLRVVFDLLTVKFLISYSTRPLHIFGLIGLLSGGIGFFGGVYLGTLKIFYGAEIGGRPLLLLVVLLILIGFQFVTMGLLGEMLARTYHESQDKPIYVIQRILDKGTPA
ncbi:MAG: glycosyltransferase family 2 protein [Candidatus Binatia bacterium]|nr:glycosyltransferase family 2 protein [Candidatus Binatia bacterium]